MRTLLIVLIFVFGFIMVNSIMVSESSNSKYTNIHEYGQPCPYPCYNKEGMLL